MERSRLRLESLILRDTQRSFVSSPSPRYFVPGDSPWPLLGALAVFLTLSGAATLMLGGHEVGAILLGLGTASLLAVVAGWFISAMGAVAPAGFGQAVNRSFRLWMLAFLGFEVLLFAVCWGGFALARELFIATPPRTSAHDAVTQGSLPLLLSSMSFLLSSATLLRAQASVQPWRRSLALAMTIVFGAVFLAVQGPQYGHALGLLGTGRIARQQSLELLCLGVHGVHVVLALVLLASLWVHSSRTHFTATQRFGLQAVTWYWHFLDVGWVLLLLMARY